MKKFTAKITFINDKETAEQQKRRQAQFLATLYQWKQRKG